MKTVIPLVSWLLLASAIYTEVLKPPIINLSENARISASSTCGEQSPESYAEDTKCGISIGVCNPENSTGISFGAVHSARFALENSERYWQSPSLAKGEQYHEVNLTVDLGHVYSVEWIHVTMANSPRPKVWALEWSTDHGQTWTAWKYFTENERECEEYFGKLDNGASCDTRYSQVNPYANGEILFATQCYLDAPWNLDQSCGATNIRLRFLRMHSKWPEDREIDTDDRYFYAVKQIVIAGRCACNGHSSKCGPLDGGVCQECQHNTCGDQCERCCRGYYRPEGVGESEPCQPCNCNSAGSFQTGICTQNGHCFCKPGWEGQQCQTRTHRASYSYEEFTNRVRVD